MPYDDATQPDTEQTVAPSDGRLTDAFMGWWAAYAELLRAERRDGHGRQIAHLEEALETARVALAQERITASRPPHNLLHLLNLPT